MNRKVTVVGGAGNVGATVARAIADKELADVVIIDIAEGKARGVALDMYEACPIEMSIQQLMVLRMPITDFGPIRRVPSWARTRACAPKWV